MWVRVAAQLTLVVMAAGCSGDSSGPDEADYAERLIRAEALGERITSQAATAPADIPTRGSATYEGNMVVRFGDSLNEGAMLGDAALRADFASQEVEGEFTDFVATVNGGEPRDYTGQLDVLGGYIGESGANSANVSVMGTLRGEGHAVTIAGRLEGGFTGPSATGLVLTQPNGRVQFDRFTIPADISVAAEAR